MIGENSKFYFFTSTIHSYTVILVHLDVQGRNKNLSNCSKMQNVYKIFIKIMYLYKNKSLYSFKQYFDNLNYYERVIWRHFSTLPKTDKHPILTNSSKQLIKLYAYCRHSTNIEASIRSRVTVIEFR